MSVNDIKMFIHFYQKFFQCQDTKNGESSGHEHMAEIEVSLSFKTRKLIQVFQAYLDFQKGNQF